MKAFVVGAAVLLMAGCAQPPGMSDAEWNYKMRESARILSESPFGRQRAPMAPLRTRSLTNEWQNGQNRMCRYDDGSVVNMGMNFCPYSY